MADDLWPGNIAENKLVSPVAIMREQGKLLGDKTKGLVMGEVTTQTTGNLFVHSFSLVAQTLRYRYELFVAKHQVAFYPVVVRYLNQEVSLGSEEEFKAKLKEIFSAQHTVNTVQSILASLGN